MCVRALVGQALPLVDTLLVLSANNARVADGVCNVLQTAITALDEQSLRMVVPGVVQLLNRMIITVSESKTHACAIPM